MPENTSAENLYPEVEERLRPLAFPLERPQPGDWLSMHNEEGQGYAEYLASRPVRPERERRVVYLQPIGELTAGQERLVALTAKFLEQFYELPVVLLPRLPAGTVPPEARRTHPAWGVPQVRSGYVLHQILAPRRPADALAMLGPG